MKRLLALLAMICSWSALAQAPLLRNSFTTNNPPKFPLLLPVPSASSNAYPVVHTDFDETILEWQGMYFSGDTNAFLRGILSAGGGKFTNSLTLNGSPVSTNAGAQVFTNDAGVIHPVDLTLLTIQFGPNDTDENLFLNPTPNTNGTGSTLTISSGAPGVDGSGGNLNIFAADATGAGDNDGGDITIQAGTATGAGDNGELVFSGGDTFINASGIFELNASTEANVNTPVVNFSDAITFSGTTNQYTDNGTTLLRNGQPVGGGTSETNVLNNFYSTNVFFKNGKGNTLTVSGQYVYPLAAGTGITFTTNNIGTGQTNITIAASGSGDTTATNIVTLTQTGTNVSAMDFSLVQRGGVFKLGLTNNAYIGAPSGVANTAFTHAWLIVQQPSTGTCALTFTNGFFAFPEGVAPIIDTNNGAVTIYEFTSDVFTNGLLHGWMSLKSKLIP